MYSNGGGPIVEKPKTDKEKAWQTINADRRPFGSGKCFVRCICPKCTDRHRVYMRWTGRGIPRKYCNNCKPLINTYDDAALDEAAIGNPKHTRKTARHHESE